MPALEALLDRFAAAHTQPFGISVDSVFSHGSWAQSLGGISFPLLADFHPKGAVAESYGLYLADKGITDRATVIIDAGGVVRHVSSVTPAGKRDIAELAALCESIDAEHGGDLPAAAAAPGLGDGLTLYIKGSCGFSRQVLWARDNLHVADALPVRDVSADAEALAALRAKAGSEQVPALDMGDRVMHESADIIAYLVEHAAPR